MRDLLREVSAAISAYILDRLNALSASILDLLRAVSVATREAAISAYILDLLREDSTAMSASILDRLSLEAVISASMAAERTMYGS